jgi:DNA-binding MurR/RpiR family transcriptional regulator
LQHRHIQRKIESSLDKLRRSERKVADYVLANSEDVIHMRTVDLAVAALCKARRVEFYGFGASNSVAIDAHLTVIDVLAAGVSRVKG